MRERSPGCWQIVVSDGFAADGKRRQHRRTVRGSKKDAANALAAFISEIEAGTLASSGARTVAEYLTLWLEDYAKPRIAASTYRRYKRDVDRFIIPTLGHVKLKKLGAGDLQSAYAAWQRDRKDGRTGVLSAQTIIHVHRIIHHALQTALKQGLVARNVASAASPPKATRREMPIMDHAQVGALLKAAKGTVMELPITLGIASGLRRSELLGLRWKDIDASRGTIVVAQALEFTPESGMRFKAPKSGKARVVAIPEVAHEAIRRHRAQQLRDRLLIGPAYNSKLDLVIAAEDGSPLHPDRFTSAFRQIVKKAGLPDCGPHTMRHCFATFGLMSGANPLVISQALGHHDPGFTLRQYAHALPTMQQQAATAMDATLRAALSGGEDRPTDGTKAAI